MEQEETYRLHGVVIACLQSGYLDVGIGYGSGLLDGGYVDRLPIEFFPLDCRMPNTKLHITFRSKSREIIRIERDEKNE